MRHQSCAAGRRGTVRIISYCAAMALILLFAIIQQRSSTDAISAAQNRLRRAVLVRMSEEHAVLDMALSDGDTSAVRSHANALCGYASLIGSCGDSACDTPITAALTDTAQFYAALMRAADGDTLQDTAFWEQCCDTVSMHTAALALAMSDRMHPTAPTVGELAAAEALSAFSASFYTEPLRLPAVSQPDYRYDREVPITMAQARQILRTLFGNTASFLGSTVTDDAHGCYVFTCRNGYAEISRSGGHLLSYAFYPRGGSGTDLHFLNDADLSSLAASFLKKAGIAVRDTGQWSARHGIRIFSAETTDGKTVSVGIRMHDGSVVSFRAEPYYRRGEHQSADDR